MEPNYDFSDRILYIQYTFIRLPAPTVRDYGRSSRAELQSILSNEVDEENLKIILDFWVCFSGHDSPAAILPAVSTLCKTLMEWKWKQQALSTSGRIDVPVEGCLGSVQPFSNK